MSKIYEIFGHRLGSNHPSAIQHIEKAQCPFMEARCDGGGNRYLSALKLANHKDLSKFFPGLDTVQAGVCSLQVQNDPWIVCPRRLLALNSPNANNLQKSIRQNLASHGGIESGVTYPVWSEVKIKVPASTKDKASRHFDYTFDYIIAGKSRKRMDDVAKIIGKSEQVCERIGNANGYTLSKHKDGLWVDNFPSDPIIIVEVMTSSTSGGNKDKRTQIATAFEDALMHGEDHQGPGINYRQVWARMASQLIAKSQIGMEWGGKTVWVIQDVLAKYISSTTGLNLQNYLSENTDEVNVLAFGYGNNPIASKKSGTIDLSESSFYAGPISKGSEPYGDDGFVDIIKIGAVPSKNHLWKSLYQKKACGTIKG